MAELLCKRMSRAAFLPRSPLASAPSGVPIEAADPWTRKIRAPEGAKQRGFARWRGFWEVELAEDARQRKTCRSRDAFRAARDLLRRSYKHSSLARRRMTGG